MSKQVKKILFLVSNLARRSNISVEAQDINFWVFIIRVPTKIFKKLPPDIKRKHIYKLLTEVKEFRNNLYHSRTPLVTKTVDIKYLDQAYFNFQTLADLLKWLDAPNHEVLDRKLFEKKAKRIRSFIRGI